MSERRRVDWGRWAEWQDDDPAIVRTREAIASSPAVRQEPPRPEPAPVVAEPVQVDVPAPEVAETVRRGRVSELVQRVKDGDLSAVEILRRLLDTGR